jgi:hypothetical protein
MLNAFCDEHNILLIDDYSNKFINRDSKIEGMCKNCECENVFSKPFRELLKINGYCQDCAKIGAKEKYKQTSLQKYGVEFTTQSKKVKDKIKQVCLEKYGVENPSQLKETKEKFKSWNWSPEQDSGISWPNRLWLSTSSINSPCFDPWDKDEFYFSTRADAMRFKKMFVDLLEGKIDWYDKRWNKNKSPIDELKQILSPRNISLKIDYIVTMYEERDDMEEADKIRELEKRIGEINYQNVINSAKNIKINSIYID